MYVLNSLKSLSQSKYFLILQKINSTLLWLFKYNQLTDLALIVQKPFKIFEPQMF